MAEKPAQKVEAPKAETPKTIKVTSDTDLFEPTLMLWIRQGQTVEIAEMTPWLQYQIDNSNGIVRIVD